MITAHDREMAESFCRGENPETNLAGVVVVCAWCDPQQIEARLLRAQGKRVTHTICPSHAAQQMARARELNANLASAKDFPTWQSGRALVLAGGLISRGESDLTPGRSTGLASVSTASAHIARAANDVEVSHQPSKCK